MPSIELNGMVLEAMNAARVVHLEAYQRALAFMNEKGVLDEFVDREEDRAGSQNPVPDAAIRLHMDED